MPSMTVRWFGASHRDPARIQLRIPNRPYEALYLLAAADEKPDTVPLVSAMFYRPSAGFAETFEGTVPAATADGRPAARLPVTLANGKRVSLWLVKIPLDSGRLSAFGDLDVVEVELTKKVHQFRSYPDPILYGYHQGGLPSSVHIYGLTFGLSPVSFAFEPDQFGHVWTARPCRRTRRTVTNRTSAPLGGIVTVTTRSYDGTEDTKRQQLFQLPPGAGVKLPFPINLKLNGYHDVTATIEVAGRTWTEKRSLVRLAPDTRAEQWTEGQGALFGYWSYHGGHHTPKARHHVELMTAAGARTSIGLPIPDHPLVKKHWARISAGAWEVSPQDWAAERPGRSEEGAPTSRRRRSRRSRSTGPTCPPEFRPDHVYFFPEPHVSQRLTEGNYPEYWHGDPLTYTEDEKQATDHVLRSAQYAAEAVRKEFPDLKVLIPWGDALFAVPLLRAGFPKNLIDGSGHRHTGFRTAAGDAAPPDRRPPALRAAQGVRKGRHSKAAAPVHRGHIRSDRAGGGVVAGADGHLQPLGAHQHGLRREPLLLRLVRVRLLQLLRLGALRRVRHPAADPVLRPEAGLRRLRDDDRPARPGQLRRLAQDRLAHHVLPAVQGAEGGRVHTLDDPRQAAGDAHARDRRRRERHGRDEQHPRPGAGRAQGHDHHGSLHDLRDRDRRGRVGRRRRAGPFRRKPAGGAKPVADLGDGSWAFTAERNKTYEHGTFAMARIRANSPRRSRPIRATARCCGRRSASRTRFMNSCRGTAPWCPRKPVVLDGAPAQFGLWVKGASDWGRVVYVLKDAKGETWTSIGTQDQYNCDDVHSWSAFNFDGWRYVRFELPGHTGYDSFRKHGTTWWRSDAGDGIVDLPLTLDRIIVEQRTHVLYVNDVQPAASDSVRFGKLYAEYASPADATPEAVRNQQVADAAACRQRARCRTRSPTLQKDGTLARRRSPSWSRHSTGTTARRSTFTSRKWRERWYTGVGGDAAGRAGGSEHDARRGEEGCSSAAAARKSRSTSG